MKKKKAEKQPVVIDIKNDISNPTKYPWPYKDGSVSELTCANVFEFIPGPERPKFMDEVYRVLEDGGKANFLVRYWNNASAYQDYAYEWPPLCEQSFLYFNAGWRKTNGLDRPMKCNFDFVYGYDVEPDTANRHDEVRSHNIKYFNNVVQILRLQLTKRPENGQRK
jgi:hypothetical protein